MANCARNVIAHNNCDDKITLIPKRSTDIVVGPGKDMELRANVLVTEVFDTELIGEGAIGTFNHAHANLLTVRMLLRENSLRLSFHFKVVHFFLKEDSIVIPSRATIFVQLVESELLSSWNRSKPIACGNHTINPPTNVATCPGNGAVNDLQLAQLDLQKFRVLSDPIPLFQLTEIIRFF